LEYNILVTTHSLEEAEYLGDRIGIMCDGQFICYGTSSFLKSKYPCGFNINLLVNSNKFTEDKKKVIFEGIKNYEPNAYIKVASKSVFSLNIKQNNEHIPEIFKFIEESKEDYDIEDYTVSSTSLEDVFLKINNQSNLNNMKYNNKTIGSQEILIPENLVEINSFFIQFISQLKRHFLTIYRNKFMLLVEYLSGLGIIYITIFLTEKLINKKYNLDLIDILEQNKLYIYEDISAKDVIEDSSANNSFSLDLNSLPKKPNNVQNLIDLAYNESIAHIAMGCISINQISDKWHTYVTSLNLGNLFADIMLLVSAFLKKEYEINAIIFNKIEMKEERNNDDYIISKTIIYIGILIGYIIFLGGLINEKIKERKTKIKHLLYLSGNNLWSYWIAFFIIDYLKLLVFSFCLLHPFNIILKHFGDIFVNLLIINASSLIFIYFISIFCSNAESGIKFLLSLLITFVILILVTFIYSIIFYKKVYAVYKLCSETLILKFFFYFSPISSFLFSFSYKMNSFDK